MTSGIKSVLEGLNRKELVKIANQKKISIPNNWSRSLIVELLALNIAISDIRKIGAKPLEPETISEGVSAIIIKDLVKKFEDITAVDNLSLEIMEGELFSLLGPNGAGKTTTINILNGIMKPTKGTATIAGFDVIRNLVEIKKIIGLCPQEAAVFKFLNARENIELFGNLHSLSKKEIEERTNTLLELLGLARASPRLGSDFNS